MSSLFAFFKYRSGRFLIAAVLLVVLQGIVFAVPSLAGARPLLSVAALTVPSAFVLLPASRLTNPFSGFSFRRDNVLGTSLDLYVATDSASTAQRCEEIVLREISRLEKILSTRDPESEINKPRAHGAPSTELGEVLQLCESWRGGTDGAFDARLGALLDVWKCAEHTNTLPTDSALNDLVLRLNEQPWNVDALGKSYILDRAGRLAKKETGVAGLLLDIGGDIIALGDGNGVDGFGWEIGVAHPDRPQDNADPMTRLVLRDQAVATSAPYERLRIIDGVSYSHILDPKTGRPATGAASATVVAADASTANALATALCTLSPAEGQELVERVADANCLIIGSDGVVHRSSGLRERVLTQNCSADAWPDNHQVTINLKLLAPAAGGRKVRRPYVAVWIEDADGKAVRTLAVWGNQPKYLRDLFDWWKLGSKDNDLVRAVTKASRAPGSYSLIWDGKDDKGKALAPGTYTFQVEVHREHGNHARQTGKLECGVEKGTVTLDATKETGETKIDFGPREK